MESCGGTNKYFNWTDKAPRQLACVNIQIDKQAMMVKALKSFKDAGDFDAAIHKWEARPVDTQIYANLKVVMCVEFSKLNQQDATTARVTGHASAKKSYGGNGPGNNRAGSRTHQTSYPGSQVSDQEQQ